MVCSKLFSVVDPDPLRSDTLCETRHFLQDPDPELEVMDSDHELDLNLIKNHQKKIGNLIMMTLKIH
jgi:hypothetical protein